MSIWIERPKLVVLSVDDSLWMSELFFSLSISVFF